MTTVDVHADGEMMDFSTSKRSIKFRIDDDVFEAAPDIPTILALEFADQSEKLENDQVTADEQAEIIRKLFTMVLFPESAERFITRLSSTEHPIGPKRFGDVLKWLFGEYGLRPTESDSPSSSGSDNPASGTNSTASIFDAASTSPNSASAGS